MLQGAYHAATAASTSREHASAYSESVNPSVVLPAHASSVAIPTDF